MSYTRAEFQEKMKDPNFVYAGAPRCKNKKCNAVLQFDINQTASKEYCDDCYYDKLGKILEKYPPHMHRPIRGT